MGRFRIDCAARTGRVWRWLTLIGCGIAAVGCDSDESLIGAGLDVKPSASWRPIDPKTRVVPGKALASWSGPQGSSLVVYRALPIPGGTAESIAASLANRLTNLPGLEIKAQRIDTVGGRSVARVEVVGPGTGDTLAPSSVGKPMAPPNKTLIATREIILGIPGPDATLFLCWDFPELARDQIVPEIGETIANLRLPAVGSASPKASY